MTEVVIGLDSSTTSTKAIAWTVDGKVAGEGRASVPMSNPRSNWYEQSPDDWWESAKSALSDLSSGMDMDRVKAIAVSNQRETLGFFRKDGSATRPAQVWLDERSREVVRDLADELGSEPDGTATIHRITGKPLDVTPSVYRIRWLQRFDPDSHSSTEIFSDVQGYLVFRLTGLWKTSWASADPLGMFDLERKRWSAPIMDAVGIDESRLSETVPSGSVIGEVGVESARETGLRPGTPVVAGGGDGQLAGLGCAALTPDTAYLNIGTALVSGIHGTKFLTSDAWRTMGGPTGQKYYYESCLRGGTFIVNWFLDTICADSGHAAGELLGQLERECADVPIGSGGLFALPYWQGVMTPHWNNDARGAFIGLSGSHGRAHMFRALMEGMAFEQQICTSSAEAQLGSQVREFVAIGGGAESSLWRQIFADVTGRSVARSETVEASSLGAAICAAVGLGWFEDFESAASSMSGRIVAVSEPNSEAFERYAELVSIYRQAYQGLLPIFTDLARIAER